jgi:hypothetical protein
VDKKLSNENQPRASQSVESAPRNEDASRELSAGPSLSNLNRRRNFHAGNCDKCRAYVEPLAGFLFKMRGCNSRAGSREARAKGQWHVRCENCTANTPSVRRDLRAQDQAEVVEMMGGARYDISHACHGN